MSDQRRGMIFGVAAYVMWGAFPLYFPLLEPADPFEILAHRIVWSALTLLVVVVLLRRVGRVRALVADRRRLAFLAIAGVTICFNWGGYIWGVNNGYVVETSLGYFINPLVTVMFGVLLLGERLRALQWASLALAGLAVVVLTLDYGRLPWIALLLAFSFGTYGLLKKQANAGAIESLTVETGVVAPVAAAYAVWLAATGASHFSTEGPGHTALMLSAGLVTVVPLVCFGAAATRVPLVTIGLLQYLAPVLQFLLGVLYFDEDMPPVRWIGFGLVWLALVLLTVEALRHRRRQLRDAAEAAAL
ncbi:MAG TPA: EamA family transporter RarD [Nocardioides sp.]|uniref:EamA family transporter RarD n=1 Tax=Nocardioides sp. TaxID=35761 RepID=UPI002ED7CB78